MTRHSCKSSIFPKYMYLPFALAVLVHFSSYFLTKLVTTNSIHYDLSLYIDECIPFLPFFIIFYVLAYAQWIFSYIYHCSESQESCYQLITSDLLSKTICIICFLLLPTTIIRPEIYGSGFFEKLTRLIFSIDSPVNLFPSMHCIMSWFCFRSSLSIRKPSFVYSAIQFILSLLIFASTVFVKQHFFIDVVFGIAVAEVCWFVTKHFSLWRVFKRREHTPSPSND